MAGWDDFSDPIDTPPPAPASRQPVTAAPAAAPPPKASSSLDDFSEPVTQAPAAVAGASAPGAQEPKDLSLSDITSGIVKNTVPSARNAALGVLMPFAHPIETAKNVADIGVGLGSKALGTVMDMDPKAKAEREATVDAMGKMYKDRYYGWNNIKNTLATDPIGMVGDLSLPLTGVGGGLRAGARAAEAAGQAGLAGGLGRVGDVASKLGDATNPMIAAGKVVSAVPKAVNITTGATSGVSPRSLNQFTENGLHDLSAWKATTNPDTELNIIKGVKDAISQEAADRNAAYQAGKAGLSSPQPLDYSKIDKAMQDAKNVAIRNGHVIDDEALKAWSAVEAKVNEWKSRGPNDPSHSVQGFDDLKQAIDNTRKNYTGSRADNVVGQVRNAVWDTINDADPKYAGVMESYQKANASLNDLRKEILGGKAANTSATIRKILGAQAGDGSKATLLDHLAEKNPELKSLVAGADVSHSGGHAIGSLSAGAILAYMMHPAALAAAPFGFPKFAAGTATAMGVPGSVGRLVGKIPGAPVAGDLAKQFAYPMGRFEAKQADDRKQKYQKGGAISKAPRSPSKINHKAAAAKLVAAVAKVRKGHTKNSEHLLNVDDNTIANALEVAKQHIEG